MQRQDISSHVLPADEFPLWAPPPPAPACRRLPVARVGCDQSGGDSDGRWHDPRQGLPAGLGALGDRRQVARNVTHMTAFRVLAEVPYGHQ